MQAPTESTYRLDIAPSYCVIREYPVDSAGSFVVLDGGVALQLHDMLTGIAFLNQHHMNRKNRGWIKGEWRSEPMRRNAEENQQQLLKMAFKFYKDASNA